MLLKITSKQEILMLYEQDVFTDCKHICC